MRRVMLLALSVLVVVSMAAVSPALAHDRDEDCWDEDKHEWVCHRDDDDKDDADVQVCLVPVFIPVGFWDFDFWNWVWFWVDLGSFSDCLDD